MKKFPNYSPFYAYIQHKSQPVEEVRCCSLVDQEVASATYIIDENVGLPCDVLRDVMKGDDVPAALVKPHNGTFAPAGLSVDEMIALGTPRGIDSLSERSKYLEYLDSQVELINGDDKSETKSETKSDSKSETNSETKSETSVETSDVSSK